MATPLNEETEVPVLNKHTATLPLSWLSARQMLWHIATRLIPNLKEEIMSALTDALARLSEEVNEQLSQTAGALVSLQEAVDNLAVSEAEKAELQARLNEALAANADAVTAIIAQADALAADDPQPEPEPEPLTLTS